MSLPLPGLPESKSHSFNLSVIAQIDNRILPTNVIKKPSTPLIVPLFGKNNSNYFSRGPEGNVTR